MMRRFIQQSLQTRDAVSKCHLLGHDPTQGKSALHDTTHGLNTLQNMLHGNFSTSLAGRVGYDAARARSWNTSKQWCSLLDGIYLHSPVSGCAPCTLPHTLTYCTLPYTLTYCLRPDTCNEQAPCAAESRSCSQCKAS